MALRLSLPPTARRLPLTDPEQAIAEFTAVLVGTRDDQSGRVASAGPKATDAVEEALACGATLMAVLTPDDAAPAVLTAVPVAVPARPPGRHRDPAAVLRDAMENVGGPDVRQTAMLATDLGKVVVAQRVPGVEQARAGRPLTLQLQAFLPDPDTGGQLLLTLASAGTLGWDQHQVLFGQIVRSASVAGDPPPRPDPAQEPEDEPDVDIWAD